MAIRLNRYIFFIPVFLALALVAPGPLEGAAGQEAWLDGEWELTTQAQQNEVTWKVVFKRTGETLEVTMTGPRGNEFPGTGTIKGQDIEWSVKRTTPQGERTLTYRGRVEGDLMSGQVQVGRLRSFPWEARRKAGGEEKSGRSV
ncbi:MAG: hypothetical protein OEW05_00255 [Candidatus Aminicenantes bacterium]|nr:hypothetical protein [Candidatus Aminicenantes bacterium]